MALQFYGRLGVHEYEGVALDLDERQRIIADLGDKRALLLRNHGLLTVGRSVAEAFQLMYYLNLCCEVQIAAQSTGAELVMPSRQVCEKVAGQYEQQNHQDGEVDLEWAAHLRLLDKIDPSYRN
jgi:ribulose-5-phosphate 4-epimerase/fuculose-1-phosphate aldolase